MRSYFLDGYNETTSHPTLWENPNWNFLTDTGFQEEEHNYVLKMLMTTMDYMSDCLILTYGTLTLRCILDNDYFVVFSNVTTCIMILS